MRPIVQDGDPMLRTHAERVPLEKIGAAEIQTLIADMHNVLALKEHGVALAAPQVGVPLRLFVVAPRVFEDDDQRDNKLVYINPEIVKRSRKTDNLEEGCLSVEGYYGTVPRAQRVTVEAYNEKGEKFTRGASGLLAQIFQHEIDHLDGVLYTDKAIETHKIENE